MLIFVLRVLCLDTERERRSIMAKVVVLDAGIGGMTAAYELRAYLGQERGVPRAAATEIRTAQSLPVTRDGKGPPYDDWHASAGRDKSDAALPRPFAGMQPL